jgi:biopolymer transport protein ExbB
MRLAIPCVLAAACSFRADRIASDASAGDAASCGAWLDPAWSRRRAFTIPAASISGTVADFPVAVVLAGDADLRARARSDAGDLRFVDGDGSTPLAHEIERYDAATGTLVAWVRVPQLANTADHTLYLYYGRAGAVASAGNVWTGYSSVWHFADGHDSSGNGHDATGAVVAVNAKLGPGLACDGVTNQVDVAMYSRPATLSYEAWIDTNDTTMSVYHAVVTDWSANDRWFGIFGTEVDFYDGGNDDHYYPTLIATTTWTHIAATYDGAMLRVYKNGVAIGSPIALALAGVTSPLQIGYNPNPSATAHERWNGTLDELRVSDVARSPDFIATAYANQVDPASFAIAGALASCP